MTAKQTRLLIIALMGFCFIATLSGAIWDAMAGDWAWRHWVTPTLFFMNLLLNVAILLRRPAR